MCNIWPNSLIVSQRFITTIFSRYITCILTIVLLTGIMRYMFYHCITLKFAKYNAFILYTCGYIHVLHTTLWNCYCFTNDTCRPGNNDTVYRNLNMMYSSSLLILHDELIQCQYNWWMTIDIAGKKIETTFNVLCSLKNRLTARVNSHSCLYGIIVVKHLVKLDWFICYALRYFLYNRVDSTVKSKCPYLFFSG